MKAFFSVIYIAGDKSLLGKHTHTQRDSHTLGTLDVPLVGVSIPVNCVNTVVCYFGYIAESLMSL